MESWKATDPSSRPLEIIPGTSGIPRPPESSRLSMTGLADSIFRFINSGLTVGYRVLSAESSHLIQSSKELLYNEGFPFWSMPACSEGSEYPPLENGKVYGETGDTVKDSSELGLCIARSLVGDLSQMSPVGILFVCSSQVSCFH